MIEKCVKKDVTAMMMMMMHYVVLCDCHLCGVHIDMQIHVIASALSIIVLSTFCKKKLHFSLII